MAKKSPSQSAAKLMLDRLDRKQDQQSEVLAKISVTLAKQESAFEHHMTQDEKAYGQIEGMNVRLDEYNKLLAVHIEGVNQLKIQNQLLKEQIDILYKESNARLEKLEAPAKWTHETTEKLKRLTVVGTAIGALFSAAVYIYSLLKK